MKVEQRMNVWLETVPILLKKLNIEHVFFTSHSAGTLYLFNTLYHLRDILDPRAPYVALLGMIFCSPPSSYRLTIFQVHGVITDTLAPLL